MNGGAPTATSAPLSASGEAIRAGAERVLRARYQVLRDRDRRRELTPVERSELEGLGAAISELLDLEAAAQSSPGSISGQAIRDETGGGQ